MAQPARNKVLDGPAIDRALSRMAQEIVDRNRDSGGCALIGIRTRGVPLARRLAARIESIENLEVPVGVLDITFYRDDFTTVGTQAILRKTEIAFPIQEKSIVLVDDVLYTGRTIRAALEGVVDLGRPRQIQLAVLVNRGHRELPIRADYVGKTISTRAEDFVQVCLKESDREDAVYVGEVAKSKKK